MKRSPSLPSFSAFIQNAHTYGKEKLRRPKRIFYKIKAFPEGKANKIMRHSTSEYEQLEQKHKQSLQQVLEQSYDEKAILECLHQMLSSQEHPYGMVVNEFGKEIINSFEGGDMGDALNEIKGRMASFSTSMAGTALLQYKDILAGVPPDEFSLLCQDAMYETLLDRDPNVIKDCYHTKFYKQDLHLCSLNETVAPKMTPALIGVSKKFWLVSKNGKSPPPYCAAISIFQQFPRAKSPLAKVAVLKDTARSICMSIEQFWDVNRADFPVGEDPSISADDLVSIFSYVIIKSKVPLLYSESEYVCDFVSDRNLMGETGYLITTLQCCCMSLAALEASELLQTPI